MDETNKSCVHTISKLSRLGRSAARNAPLIKLSVLLFRLCWDSVWIRNQQEAANTKLNMLDCFRTGEFVYGRKSRAEPAPPLSFGWKKKCQCATCECTLLLRRQRRQLDVCQTQPQKSCFPSSCFFTGCVFFVLCLTAKSMKVLQARALQFAHTLAFLSAHCKWKFI